jgi:hypothetical protein
LNTIGSVANVSLLVPAEVEINPAVFRLEPFFTFPVYQCRGYVMNREKSEAKFICIPDCHAFIMDLWCAGLLELSQIKTLAQVTVFDICCEKKKLH